jgi:hypothetical protein
VVISKTLMLEGKTIGKMINLPHGVYDLVNRLAWVLKTSIYVVFH